MHESGKKKKQRNKIVVHCDQSSLKPTPTVDSPRLASGQLQPPTGGLYLSSPIPKQLTSRATRLRVFLREINISSLWIQLSQEKHESHRVSQSPTEIIVSLIRFHR